MNIQCVLCLNNITNSTDRYILDKSTKSGTEAGKLLENLPFEVNETPVLGKNLYVCKKCFRELKKRENILRNLHCCEEQLGFNKGYKKRKVSSCEAVNAGDFERSNDVSTGPTKECPRMPGSIC